MFNKKDEEKLGKHARVQSEDASTESNTESPAEPATDISNTQVIEPVSSEDFSAQSPTADAPEQSTFETQEASFFDIPSDYDEGLVPKKRSGKKAGIVCGVIVAVLLVVYVAGGIFFSSHFFPNTVFGAHDVSMKSDAEVEAMFDKQTADYSLDITGEGLSFTLTSDQAGLQVDSAKIVSDAQSRLNGWAWPVEVFKSHDETDSMAATYNDSGLEQIVTEKVTEFNKTAKPAQSATLQYVAAKSSFEIVPEVMGTQIDIPALVSKVDESILMLDSTCKITDDELAKPAITESTPALSDALKKANGMLNGTVTLTMAGNAASTIDAATLSAWIILDDNCNVTFDQAALEAWADTICTQCDTIGTTRTYTRADGKAITVGGGAYGWEVDREALIKQVSDSIASGSPATLAIPCSQEGDVYAGPGQRDWGPNYVDIDLAEQVVRYYDATGACTFETSCITGMPDGEHDTPAGVYKINGMESPSTLIGYNSAGQKEYTSQVTFWMPFVGNGIGMHDATWQPGFGGNMYASGYGSHGCVNLSYSAAATMYDLIHTGLPVITHW